ncbi:hypothetical protein Tco_0449733, partial [Tanacetum coccineum]
LDSAGRTMFLLSVIVPVGCFISAGGFISADGVAVYAANTSIYAAELVCAGRIKFLLANLFMLVVTCFCCLNFASAVLCLILLVGWSLPHSHLVSAGSIQSCW